MLNYHADVTSTIKKLNQTVTFPRGTATTSLDLATRKIVAGSARQHPQGKIQPPAGLLTITR